MFAMNKKLVVLSALVLMTSCQAYVVFDATALGSDGYTVMWAIELPREVYFIGETVSFTVVAFVSSDPDILLPDQMAKITIRNGTLFEVYSAWITTNANGSAPVTWETGLDAATGNYTIILEDLADTKVVANFVVLYNEETYWQTRVDLLERDLQTQYEYLNYLFAHENYLQRQLQRNTRILHVLSICLFAVLFLALWTWFPELAKRARAGKGVYDQLGRGLAAMGITSEPVLYLQHEEVSQLSVPPDKAAPRFNVEFYCEICDPQHGNKMTLQQYEDHVFMHDKHYARPKFWKAWRRERARDAAKKADEPEKLPEPAYASIEEYKKEWTEEKARENLQARLDLIKMQHKKKLITDAQAKAKVAQVRADLEAVNAKTQVLKQTPSAKVPIQRKVREKEALSGILKAPQKIPTPIPSSKSALDELFDKLNHEKVN